MLLGLIETEETAHDTSYMPPTLKTPYHKWEGSLFIFVRKDACLTWRTLLQSSYQYLVFNIYSQIERSFWIILFFTL